MAYSVVINIIMSKNASDMLTCENHRLKIIGSMLQVLLKITAKRTTGMTLNDRITDYSYFFLY